MLSILRLGGGLLLLIVANIAIGSIRAAVAREWDTKTFVNGLIKGAIVIGAFVAVYFAGWLNPDLVVVELEGQTVNLATGVYFVLLAGFTYYAGKVLLKLKDIITTKKSSTGEQEKAPEKEQEESEKMESAIEKLTDMIEQQNERSEKSDEILRKLYEGMFGAEEEMSEEQGEIASSP